MTMMVPLFFVSDWLRNAPWELVVCCHVEAINLLFLPSSNVPARQISTCVINESFCLSSILRILLIDNIFCPDCMFWWPISRDRGKIFPVLLTRTRTTINPPRRIFLVPIPICLPRFCFLVRGHIKYSSLNLKHCTPLSLPSIGCFYCSAILHHLKSDRK